MTDQNLATLPKPARKPSGADMIPPAWRNALLPIAVFLFGYFFFSWNLDERDFWAPDEPDYAQVVKEMENRNDFLVPHLNRVPYSEKPPLFYWFVALADNATGGPKEFSSRLPSVFAGAIGLVIIFLFGRTFFSEKVGLLAALFLATTFQYGWRSTYLQTDMLFSCFIYLAIFLFWKIYQSNKTDFWPYPFLFYIALGLATMTKGPLAIVLVSITILGLTFRSDKRQLIRKLYIVPGLIVLFLGTSWWYLLAWKEAGEEFIFGAFVREHWMRFFDSDSHNRPFYHYAVAIWADAAPWSLFLPYGVWKGWKYRKDPRILFLFSWAVGSFIFLSLCSSKQGKYLLPAYPAITLLILFSLEKLESQVRYTEPLKVGLNIVFSVGTLVSGIALWFWITDSLPGFVEDNLHRRNLETSMVIEFLPILFPLGYFGLVCLFLRNLSVRKKLGIFALGVFTCLFTATYFYKDFNRYKSARPLMERTAARMEPGSKLGVFGSFRGAYGYYTNQYVEELPTPNAVAKFLQQEVPVYFIVRKKWELEYISERIDTTHWVVDEGRIGSKKFLIVSNRKPKSDD